MKNKGENPYHKVYKNVKVVKFEKDCLKEICEDLGLESLINCSKRRMGGSITCNCDELTNFAKAIEVGMIEILPNTICRHRICKFSENCVGKIDNRSTGFNCDLKKLIDVELAKIEVKNKENKDNKLQLTLFK